MSDLVADRVNLALNKTTPQFLQAAGGKTKAEAGVRELFDYCGRPLESELRHEETGFFAAADGRRLPMRAFFIRVKQLNIRKVSVFSLSGLCQASMK